MRKQVQGLPLEHKGGTLLPEDIRLETEPVVIGRALLKDLERSEEPLADASRIRHPISPVESSAVVDAPSEYIEIDLPRVPEVVNLNLHLTEEKSAPPASMHPRPLLPSRIAIIGNYLPRRCGIATFTTDLCDAIHGEFGATELLALPVNDTPEGYSYPARIRFELSQDELTSYRQAADFLNFSNIDLVCLQHEYGIFGGPAGGHILELLRRLTHAGRHYLAYGPA